MASTILGIKDFHKPRLLGRQLLGELLGTMVLVAVGCGSCVGGDQDGEVGDQANIVRISLAFGLTLATLAATLGHVSGCHVNPAVTLGLVVGRKMGVLRALLYMAAQSLGAIMGAGLLWVFIVPEDPGQTLVRGGAGLGATRVNEFLGLGQAFVIETVITMVLVMVVFAAAADEGNTKSVLGSPPLAIGLAVTTCHLFAVPFTGSSMNPARSLGPAVVLGDTSQLWLYWAAPLTGGSLAGLLYQTLLRASPAK